MKCDKKIKNIFGTLKKKTAKPIFVGKIKLFKNNVCGNVYYIISKIS